MKMRKLYWLIGIQVMLLFACLSLLSYPAIKFHWLTGKWENQIKREQDPEALRTWAKELLERCKNNHSSDTLIQTNKIPFVIPNSGYGRYIWIYYENETNGQASLNPTQDYVGISWGSAWLGSWGLKIGDTNFICNSSDIWKPGIYFFPN